MNYYVFPGLEKRFQKKIIVGNVDHIINTVCELYDVSCDEIKTKSRKREFTLPRQISIYFLRIKTGMPLKKIGKLFGDRDHSTVIHSIETVKDAMCVDKKFRLKIEKIESLI